ncbi:MAG: hypothetical protein GEV08_11055 [Acidimicrobiia bacterium]|nr:hypothetical protein [Acidimicrobiia bacterium]
MVGTGTSAADVVARTSTAVLELGRAWLIAPETNARGEALGLLPGRGFWVCGRGGVLGDVDADVVAAAVGFMHPDRLRTFWESRPAELAAAKAASEYADCCFTWARRALAGVPEPDLARLTELTRTVVDAALPALGGALFAGWRAVPAPKDAAASAALALQALRELRGGAHLTAVLATGLTPLDAALAAEPPRGGPAWARDLGWPEPYPDAAALVPARAEAERLTSELVAPAYEVLSPAERSRFVELVLAARAAVG